jgi:hypothetical protein
MRRAVKELPVRGRQGSGQARGERGTGLGGRRAMKISDGEEAADPIAGRALTSEISESSSLLGN